MSLLGDLFGRTQSLPPPLEHGAKARAFVFRDMIIVTSVIGIFDGPDPVVWPQDVDDRRLGQSIFDCIRAFRHAHRGEPIGTTMREWPAFKASGIKTVKAFQAELWDVQLSAHNLVVEYRARPCQTLRPHLQMYATANQHDIDQIGATFKEVIKGAQALRVQGVV